MARISLDQLRANRPTANRAKIDATREEDIRLHMIEDGEDPDAESVGYRLVLSVTAIRERLGMTQIAFAKRPSASRSRRSATGSRDASSRIRQPTRC